MPVLVPRPNGRGALYNGGTPGNKGGTGRPKEEVRERLVGIAAGNGFEFLDKLMSGEIVVGLVGKCESCGEMGKPHTAEEIKYLLERVGTSVDQRLKGLDTALRYGVGTKDELDIRNHPEVQAFMQRHAQATVEVAGEEAYKKIAARIKQLAA
ncbi:MAG TPA: hypothetical protein VJ825_06495 [Gemmatimonadaceae bacterium]|nr:hypothetical protein [Gemmatimonadaceae bacterium]